MAPPLQRCQVHDWPPFYIKYMNDPGFLDPYVKGPFLLHLGICTYFWLRDFSRLLVFGIQWIDCDICLTTSNKWVQKISKGSIWIGHYFGWSSIWMGPFLRRCDIGVPWPVRSSFRHNWLVSATPPTVFGQSFWNFTDILAIVCRCAYCLLIILRFFFQLFPLC